jgi:hypothetical protein
MKYIKTVYCLYQSDVGVQVTVCQSLDLPHGQFVGKSLPTSGVHLQLIHPEVVHYPTSLLLSNAPVQSVAYPDVKINLPWNDILDHVYLKSGKSRSSENAKRQKHFLDYGFCGGEGYTPNGVDAGLSSPSPLDGTLDEFSFFKNLAKEITHIIRKENLNIWKTLPLERRKRFSEQLCPGCPFEFCRLAVTDFKEEQHSDKAGTCGLHCDDKNCSIYSGVLVLSKIVFNGAHKKRVSVVMCQRKSCEDYMRRATESYGPALLFVMNKYEEIPSERKDICVRLNGCDTAACVLALCTKLHLATYNHRYIHRQWFMSSCFFITSLNCHKQKLPLLYVHGVPFPILHFILSKSVLLYTNLLSYQLVGGNLDTK